MLPDEELGFKFTTRCGFVVDQGKREYMEDKVMVVENLVDDDEESGVGYFAVFDGHAGVRAADICCNTMHDTIQNHDDFPEGDMEKMLRVSLNNNLVVCGILGRLTSLFVFLFV